MELRTDYKTPVTKTEHVATESEKVYNVPEGGWGWIVVMATLAFNIIYDGISYSFGILYIQFLDYFDDTKSNTAWIGSLFFSVPLLCAPLASMLTQKLGSKTATMLGGFIASAGFAIGAFSNSIWMLIISYGLVGGFGMSLPYFNSLKIVTDYFDKRLAFASGIAESGAGLGTVIFAPFTSFLVSTYGWRGTLLILSGIIANIIVCGALYRPLKCRNKNAAHNVDEDLDTLLQVPSCTEIEVTESVGGKQKTHNPISDQAISDQLTSTSSILDGRAGGTRSRDHHFRLYLSQLKRVPFVLFAISNFVMYFWYDVPYVFMVDRSIISGISSQESSYLLSIIGFVHLFSIIGYGILGDRKCVNRALLYGMSTAFCGTSIVLVPLFHKLSALAILSGCFGLFSAATEALLSCVLIDIVGKKAFDNFFCGLVLFLEGIANLIGPPIAGLLFDRTGNYDATFYVAGSCIIVAGISYVTLSRTRTHSVADNIQSPELAAAASG